MAKLSKEQLAQIRELPAHRLIIFQDFLDTIDAIESDLAEAKRGSEMGPCGHPKACYVRTAKTHYTNDDPVRGFVRIKERCTLCSDLTAAYERGLRDAAQDCRSLAGSPVETYAFRRACLECEKEILERGAKGGSE